MSNLFRSQYRCSLKEQGLLPNRRRVARQPFSQWRRSAENAKQAPPEMAGMLSQLFGKRT